MESIHKTKERALDLLFAKAEQPIYLINIILTSSRISTSSTSSSLGQLSESLYMESTTKATVVHSFKCS